MPSFSHNPTVVGPTPDGYYLVYSIGGDAAGSAEPVPQSRKLDCTNGLPSCASKTKGFCRSGQPPGNGQIVLSYAKNIEGPWTHRVVMPINSPAGSLAAWNCAVNNPTALINDTTGAVTLMYHGTQCEGNLRGERLGLADAAHWNDTEYVKRPGPPIISPDNGTGSHEDPFMWRDRRGNYHVLTHDQSEGNLCGDGTAGHSCGAHLFSRDTYTWKVSKEGAYSSAVVLKSNGSLVHTGTRQRPQIVFADDGYTPLWLFNGASFEGNNPDLGMLTHTLAFEFES